jgi:hypothetical protein
MISRGSSFADGRKVIMEADGDHSSEDHDAVEFMSLNEDKGAGDDLAKGSTLQAYDDTGGAVGSPDVVQEALSRRWRVAVLVLCCVS